MKVLSLNIDGRVEIEAEALMKAISLGAEGLEEVEIEVSGGTGWQPPSDWIDISEVGDNEINLLVSDGSTGVAFAVTTSSGTYSIDWGDGVIDTARASGITYSHQYTIGAGQSVNGGQYTVFRILIYGATGDITRFQIKKHPEYTRVHYAPLLWAVFGTTAITTYANTFYTNAAVECKGLQACTVSSFASCSSTAAMFYDCPVLSSVILPTSWGSVESVYAMFSGCYNLNSITLPTSWGSVTNTSNMFNACYALSSVILPTSWGNVTSTINMFYSCYSLRTLANLEYLGSQTAQSDFTDIMRDCEVLQGTVTIASLLKKIGIYGASGYKLQLTGIRLTNADSTFTGSSPQVNVSYTNLDAAALETLFGDLPTLTGKTITITGATGAATCDTSIATAKGWIVTN